ncbi:PEST proteolytic signal-containing nuclear protein-like isoform X2 [Lycorma delicatula]|uniref:PEST proteolytic signal-containing nuclear protein-like isoform X2 n=1 Tax=Lycorma delicatula TaxID=130591 RepID=UPI003F511D97
MSKRTFDEIDQKGPDVQDNSKQENSSDDGNEDNKKKKMTFNFIKKSPGGFGSKPVKAINIKLEPQKSNVVTSLKTPLQSVFNSDSEEEEEMPREARMRMRNIGRETPTSAGPNSFGKTKQGFCDAKYVFEKKLKKATLEHSVYRSMDNSDDKRRTC